MKPQDIVPILEKQGFQNLKLVKHEEKSVTFKFTSFSERLLRKNLGVPSVTSDKKVMVFTMPDVGRIGVSPSNDMVRFIAQSTLSKPVVDTSHLAEVDVPKAYINALEKAKVSPALRLPWLSKMWAWYNTHKFGGKMAAPHFMIGPRYKKQPTTTRGVYQGDPGFQPGNLFLADYLFNARNEFILEILLHEMCHQAVWVIDQHRDTSKLQGHGPNWQAWMRKVGLDPRRYDPTDSVEYMDTHSARAADAELTRQYGPRVPLTHWKDLVPVPVGYVGDCVVRYKERALEGYMGEKTKGRYPFRFRAPDGTLSSLVYPEWPKNIYHRKQK